MNYFWMTVTLLVTGASAVQTDEVSVFVMEGDSVTLHTDVTKTQVNKVKWYYNGTRIAQITGDPNKSIMRTFSVNVTAVPDSIWSRAGVAEIGGIAVVVVVAVLLVAMVVITNVVYNNNQEQSKGKYVQDSSQDTTDGTSPNHSDPLITTDGMISMTPV